jgi:hypothetical protein
VHALVQQAFPLQAPFVHVDDALQAVHPLLPSWHVSTALDDTHCVVALVHALVQHAPPLHAPLLHGVVLDSNTQPWPSVAQVALFAAFTQTVPAALQTGSISHVHFADPAGPVHACLAPQAVGAAYDQHPLLPSVQVASPPDTHVV